MKTRPNKRKADSLLALLLFALFAASILSVLLTGADAYQRLSQRDEASYDRRTAAQYLLTRVRQADSLDAVSVEEFRGLDALVLAEEIDGERYETWVYCHEGYLRELFTAAGGDFLPGDGEKVLEARSLSLTLEGRTLHAELLDPSGETQRLLLSLRSGEEVAP